MMACGSIVLGASSFEESSSAYFYCLFSNFLVLICDCFQHNLHFRSFTCNDYLDKYLMASKEEQCVRRVWDANDAIPDKRKQSMPCINTLIGGLTLVGSSNSLRKAYSRGDIQGDECLTVGFGTREQKRARTFITLVMFMDEDARGVILPMMMP
ncbi:hypothetical protein OWV82_010880 [Melia azedarach]|uniref:Uncharacterized protein n=1 Tax=Melia azedarach TaxID=155640 RepID=A0ACC1Y9P8_MELAZ|nr:hypothetical protein OWV82_010880 [Melia azedarach]